jgi:hypothetical protein
MALTAHPRLVWHLYHRVSIELASYKIVLLFKRAKDLNKGKRVEVLCRYPQERTTHLYAVEAEAL